MYMYSYCYVCSALGIVFHCVDLCICVQMCTVLLPPGVNPLAFNKYIISKGSRATGIRVLLVYCSRHDGHIVRCPSSWAIKTDRVSENGYVCVFRWKGERETFAVRNVAFLASGDGWCPKHYSGFWI